MHKIFNRNAVKIGYSCMKNIGSIISAHNRNILNPLVQFYGCNCRVKSSCALNGKCLIPKIIYIADVSNDGNSDKRFYFGLADTPFKERYRNHTRDFKHEKYKKCTELTKYIWQLKRSNINISIKYSPRGHAILWRHRFLLDLDRDIDRLRILPITDYIVI